MPILVNLDIVMATRKKTLNYLHQTTGMTLSALSRLKNNRLLGMRFETLSKLCVALECTPNDILQVVTTEEFVKIMGRLPFSDADLDKMDDDE